MANFNFNKVILGGRLTADPELKTTPSGVSVTSFTVAVNRRFQGKDAEAQADFINVTAWRQTAEFVTRFFRKASSICIVGSIQTRSWVDQQGQKRFATEVVADEAYFVDAKSESPASLHQNAPMGVPMGMPQANQYVPSNYGGEPAFSSQGNGTPNFTELSDDEELPF